MEDKTRSKKFKLRFAIMFGYNGRPFHGLQKTKDYLTVEEVLEKSFFDAGFISESNFGNLKKLGWGRASRTDKGVHASINVVSVMLCISSKYVKDSKNPDPVVNKTIFREKIDIDWIIKEINAVLHESVKVFSMKFVTKHFNVRSHASSRKYEYLLPLELLKGKM